MAGECCRKLLSEGLDLCVRARKMDAQERTNDAKRWSVDGDAWEQSGKLAQYAERNNAVNHNQPMSLKSASLPLWLLDQYEKDLADWEMRARRHLMEGCTGENNAS
jgi:hypothetical protein